LGAATTITKYLVKCAGPPRTTGNHDEGNPNFLKDIMHGIESSTSSSGWLEIASTSMGLISPPRFDHPPGSPCNVKVTIFV
jgi:hypothetical protein